jgi:hypothetical protein
MFRTKEWWNSVHISWAHNCTMKPTTTRQIGGSALFSIDKAAHRVVEKGSDETKLGRYGPGHGIEERITKLYR